ncbi:hypothetical protein SAMN05421803_101546 [Nocardiopsis flavescens]|uniref:Uncharacterized protein n=1 Tax=Nocardiopsis flavescens TaxID=758803 RepID=A0A1M6C167_9ACTN|nr:hypothetical protein [Nocardiopsis flavescens]SHI54789.1 hypothetical protein SAMN05421803_101546 [Nocardiopsis flavescens]
MADERAVHPVGEESGVRWEETWTAGDLLLLTGYGPGGPRARAYDARTGDPAGPLLDTPPLSLLLDTPGGDPSVAHAEGHDLVLRDPRTGRVRERLAGAVPWDPEHLLHVRVAEVAGRPLVLFLDSDTPRSYARWAVDPATGAPVDELRGAWNCDHEHERFAVAGPYLVVQAHEEEAYFFDDGVDICYNSMLHLHGMPSGERIGEVERRAGWHPVAAVVGGRPLLSDGRRVLSLPDLEVVADFEGLADEIAALAEWDGEPVALATRRAWRGADAPDILEARPLARPQESTPIAHSPRYIDSVSVGPDGTVAFLTESGARLWA